MSIQGFLFELKFREKYILDKIKIMVPDRRDGQWGPLHIMKVKEALEGEQQYQQAEEGQRYNGPKEWEHHTVPEALK